MNALRKALTDLVGYIEAFDAETNAVGVTRRTVHFTDTNPEMLSARAALAADDLTVPLSDPRLADRVAALVQAEGDCTSPEQIDRILQLAAGQMAALAEQDRKSALDCYRQILMPARMLRTFWQAPHFPSAAQDALRTRAFDSYGLNNPEIGLLIIFEQMGARPEDLTKIVTWASAHRRELDLLASADRDDAVTEHEETIHLLADDLRDVIAAR